MTSLIATYSALALLTTLYAVLLDRHKEKWEPDWTWGEVAVGVALCLAAAAIAARQCDPSWRDYELLVWASFVVGGTPIIIWQLKRMVGSRDEAITYERSKTLAQKRRSREK